MNREGDSPDYEELYSEIHSQNKLIDLLYERIDGIQKEKDDLLEALIRIREAKDIILFEEFAKQIAINAINKATK